MERVSGDALKRLPGLNSLSSTVLERLVRFGHLQTLKAKRIIRYQKDRCESCLCVIAGKINKIKYLSDESSVKIGCIGPGEWIGIAEMLMTSPYLFDSLAETDVSILEFSTANFFELLDFSEFQSMILKRLSHNLILMHRNLELNTPRARITQLLQDQVVVDDRGVCRVNMTQDNMAAETGTTRETVNRYLKELEKLDVIRTGRGALVITDLQRLDEML